MQYRRKIVLVASDPLIASSSNQSILMPFSIPKNALHISNHCILHHPSLEIGQRISTNGLGLISEISNGNPFTYLSPTHCYDHQIIICKLIENMLPHPSCNDAATKIEERAKCCGERVKNSNADGRVTRNFACSCLVQSQQNTSPEQRSQQRTKGKSAATSNPQFDKNMSGGAAS